MKIIAALILVPLLPATSARGQDWREIKPIESTHRDVVRLFGEKTMDGGPCGALGCSYKLPKGGSIHFSFPLPTCDGVPPGSRNNFPRGAVSRVTVFPGPSYNLFISDLNVDESKLITGDPGDRLNVDVYESRELGIKIEAGKDKRIVTLEYFPASKYDKMLTCPSPSEAKPNPPAGRE